MTWIDCTREHLEAIRTQLSDPLSLQKIMSNAASHAHAFYRQVDSLPQ